MQADITWVENYPSSTAPRRAKLLIRDPLLPDECRWFRAAIENQIFLMRDVLQSVLDLKYNKKQGRIATCLDPLNGMLPGLKKLSALASDNFQVIICEGILIDGYRLIGGIICL